MKAKYYLLGFVFLFVGVGSYAQNKQFEVACVAFYNVENLFDTIDDPNTIDEEYLPNSSIRWNTEKYVSKLSHLSDVISEIGKELLPGGPTILGLSEIENRLVLEDLTQTDKLLMGNYGIVHYNSPDARGVDVALIYKRSRFKVLSSQAFPLVTDDPTFKTRDQLLVTGLLDGDSLHIIVNHWPSRRGGKQAEDNRCKAGELSRKITNSILENNPNAKIIIMGDLNDDPTDKSIVKCLGVKGKKADVKETTDLYNPMIQLYKDGIGSYAYQNSWDLFDQQIFSKGLLSEDKSTYQLFKTKVFNDKRFTQKDGDYKGYPWRTFSGGRYTNGYSDHFAVYSFLIREIKP